MRIALLIYGALFMACGVSAQSLRGTVADGETLRPLSRVSVLNISTAQQTSTDSLGGFLIRATGGDTISFTLKGYHTVRQYAVPGIPLNIDMHPLSVKLPEYVVHELTPFQKDSIEMTQLYSKELSKKAVKPGFSSANGGGFTGLIGGPVQKISRSYKQNKKFKENFRKDMEQKYIDTKYTPALVTSLTGLTGDTLVSFMNTYPMEYDFARHGTDLEIKVWIRENYKKYKPKSGVAGPSPDSIKNKG